MCKALLIPAECLLILEINAFKTVSQEGSYIRMDNTVMYLRDNLTFENLISIWQTIDSFFHLTDVQYRISVLTGGLWNAGTEAEVYITVYGERGDTGVRHLLNDGPGDKFRKGQVRFFLFFFI